MPRRALAWCSAPSSRWALWTGATLLPTSCAIPSPDACSFCFWVTLVNLLPAILLLLVVLMTASYLLYLSCALTPKLLALVAESQCVHAVHAVTLERSLSALASAAPDMYAVINTIYCPMQCFGVEWMEVQEWARSISAAVWSRPMQQPLAESVSLDSRTKGCWWGRHRSYTNLGFIPLRRIKQHSFRIARSVSQGTKGKLSAGGANAPRSARLPRLTAKQSPCDAPC